MSRAVARADCGSPSASRHSISNAAFATSSAGQDACGRARRDDASASAWRPASSSTCVPSRWTRRSGVVESGDERRVGGACVVGALALDRGGRAKRVHRAPEVRRVRLGRAGDRRLEQRELPVEPLPLVHVRERHAERLPRPRRAERRERGRVGDEAADQDQRLALAALPLEQSRQVGEGDPPNLEPAAARGVEDFSEPALGGGVVAGELLGASCREGDLLTGHVFVGVEGRGHPSSIGIRVSLPHSTS
jgi:hypothetical protein